MSLVGRVHVELKDAYKSIKEALDHAGAENETKVHVRWVHSEKLKAGNGAELKGLSRTWWRRDSGTGASKARSRPSASPARRVPFLGICLGMSVRIEFARNVLGMEHAHSTEMDASTEDAVIDLMAGQRDVEDKGRHHAPGRLPLHAAGRHQGEERTAASRSTERHRHRYEFNNAYRKRFEKGGMVASGINPEGDLVEIVELKDHPWFIGAVPPGVPEHCTAVRTS